MTVTTVDSTIELTPVVDAHTLRLHERAARGADVPPEIAKLSPAVAQVLANASTEAAARYRLNERNGTSSALISAQGVVRIARGRVDVELGKAAVADELADARNDVHAIEADQISARADLTASASSGDLEKMLRARSALEMSLPVKLDSARQRVANLHLLGAETASGIFRDRVARCEAELADLRAAIDSAPADRAKILAGQLEDAEQRASVLCSVEAQDVIGAYAAQRQRELDQLTARIIGEQQQRIARLIGDDATPAAAEPAPAPQMVITGHTADNRYPAPEPKPVYKGSHVSVPRYVDGANPYQPQVSERY